MRDILDCKLLRIIVDIIASLNRNYMFAFSKKSKIHPSYIITIITSKCCDSMLDGAVHIVQNSLDLLKHEAEQRGKFVWFVKCKSPSLWPKQWGITFQTCVSQRVKNSNSVIFLHLHISHLIELGGSNATYMADLASFCMLRLADVKVDFIKLPKLFRREKANCDCSS